MEVEDVLSLWERDAKIDKTRLGDESISVEQLHAKWKKVQVQAKREARGLEREHKVLRLERFRMYTEGAVNRNEAATMIPTRGRIVKTEAWTYVDADPVVLESAERWARARDVEEAVTDVMRMIAARGYRIDGALEAWKFENGR